MKVLNKDKAKGKVHGTMKKLKKHNRLVEEKETAIRTENKRVNAENRKAKAEEKALLEKIKNVKIVDFVKEMLLIEIDGKVEKRALIFDRRYVTLENFRDRIDFMKIKLYGEEYKLTAISNFKDVKEDILWKMQEIFE